jgi:hypothetical protein
MKNTLAENMLRFGVKNLSNSDVKKINESSLLTEGFKGQDGITYALNFKDQAAFDTYYTDFPQTVGATPPWVYGIPKDSDQRAAAAAKWGSERFNLMKCIMLAMAYKGYEPKFLKGLSYAFVLTLFQQTVGIFNASKAYGADTNFSMAYSDLQNRSKDWAKLVKSDPNTSKEIPYWEQFRNVYLAPLVTAKTSLIVPKAATPANPVPPVKN